MCARKSLQIMFANGKKIQRRSECGSVKNALKEIAI